MKQLFIPDVQAKEGVPFDHLDWIGRFIVDKKPDVIIQAGDFADMPSLSSYDRGKKCFEGRRYKKDIGAAREAMDRLLAPLKEFNKRQRESKHAQYKPRMILTLGNHEERIKRAVEAQAELEGIIGYHDLPYEDWEVYDYLEPVFIDGICYTHFMANPFTGKPYSGMSATILKTVGTSFVTGHVQKLDVATRHLVSGEQQWGIQCGACYLHDEEYKGYQGNHHWRGVIMLHDVMDGSFDPMLVRLDYLGVRYG
jgi:hypothetical protein